MLKRYVYIAVICAGATTLVYVVRWHGAQLAAAYKSGATETELRYQKSLATERDRVSQIEAAQRAQNVYIAQKQIEFYKRLQTEAKRSDYWHQKFISEARRDDSCNLSVGSVWFSNAAVGHAVPLDPNSADFVTKARVISDVTGADYEQWARAVGYQCLSIREQLINLIDIVSSAGD